jgi:hypothetical protein
MLRRLQEKGFLISQEVRGLLHKSEVAEGLVGDGKGGAPDKKAVNRLMALCVDSKHAKMVHLMLSTFTGEARQVRARLGWPSVCARRLAGGQRPWGCGQRPGLEPPGAQARRRPPPAFAHPAPARPCAAADGGAGAA